MKGELQFRRPSQPLGFMSINVGRVGTTQDIALARACELQLDLQLIQEPWWSGRTRSHPFFECHLPFGRNDVRPRAVTCTQKNDQKIVPNQKFPSTTPTGDYYWVEVNGATFLNVYKEPHNDTAAITLINWTPPQRSPATGDFNFVHWAWQPSAANSYGQGEKIKSWAEINNLICLIIGEPTHRAENTLDLAWSNINGACAWVDRDKCMTSDHLPICGSAPCFKRGSFKPKGALKVPTDKLPQFAQIVAQWITPLPSLNSERDIDESADNISIVLQEALNAVGRRPNRRKGKSARW